MSVKVKLIVRGVVQKVGYRWIVRDEANKLGINGIVRNLPDKTVEVICEAKDEATLKEFISEISRDRFLSAKVDKVERTDYLGKINKGFEIILN